MAQCIKLEEDFISGSNELDVHLEKVDCKFLRAFVSQTMNVKISFINGGSEFLFLLYMYVEKPFLPP